MNIRRRALLTNKRESSQYEGFEYNKALIGGDRAFTLQDLDGYAVSPYYDVANQDSITCKFGFTSTEMGANCFYGDILEPHYTYWARTDPRTFKISNAGIKKMRVTLKVSEMDDCYIIKNGEYLFKGKNVN